MIAPESPNDEFYMRRAAELAQRALGNTTPNPIVGAVIVRDGEILGEGWHTKAGCPHAEIEAIRDYDTTIRKRKAEMKSSIDILDGIIKDGAVSDNNLRLLVDNIVIHESDGKLSINIDLKAAFSSHLDLYDEDGALTAKAFAAN